jgi:hypothetical protein
MANSTPVMVPYKATAPTPESAIDQTLQALESSKLLSADLVAYDKNGAPVISVINVKTREHWHLTVHLMAR